MCSHKPLMTDTYPRNQGPHLKWIWGGLEISWNKTYFEHSKLPKTSPPNVPHQVEKLSLSSINLDNAKKSWIALKHFCIFPWQKAQMFLANGHSHSMGPTILGCWQHRSHRGKDIWACPPDKCANLSGHIKGSNSSPDRSVWACC